MFEKEWNVFGGGKQFCVLMRLDTWTPAVLEWEPGSASAGLLGSGRKKSFSEWWNTENAVGARQKQAKENNMLLVHAAERYGVPRIPWSGPLWSSVMLNLSQSGFTGPRQRAHLMSVCLTSMIDHLRAALRTFDEKGGIVCVNVHTSAHFSCPLVKQNLWNAEECHFWTGARSYYKQVSPALCSPNITHGLHFHIKASARTCML